MGLLKKLLIILIFVSFLLSISGCAKSIIKILSQKDDFPVSQFAGTPERIFFVPLTLTDSLKLLWENDVHGSFNNSSFVFFDSTVIVHDLSGRIHTFNIYTGKQTGVLKYKGAVFSTPLIFGFNIVTALVINNENKTELYYYDFLNGKEIKMVEISGKVINQMLKVDEDLVLITENGIVKRLNARGIEKWSKKINSFIHSSPAYFDGRIYFGNDEGEFNAISFETSESVYKKKIGASFSSGVTIKNEIAYVSDDNGTIFAINVNDGSLKWQYETGSRIMMNTALDHDNVFVANLSGSIFCLDQSDGRLKWKKDFNGAVFNSTPLVTNNRLIISDLFKSVFIIDKTNGEVKKKLQLDNRAKLTPAIRNNILFIGYDNGIVRAYEIID